MRATDTCQAAFRGRVPGVLNLSTLLPLAGGRRRNLWIKLPAGLLLNHIEGRCHRHRVPARAVVGHRVEGIGYAHAPSHTRNLRPLPAVRIAASVPALAMEAW